MVSAEDVEQPATEALPAFAQPGDVDAFTKGKLKAAEPRVAAALAAISRSIRREAGWHVWPILTGHTVKLDGDGGSTHALPTLKLHRLVSVLNAGTPVDLEAVDFSEDTGLIQRMDGGLWTRRLGRLVVTMDHGYGTAPDLAALCVSLAARGLASPLGATQESAGSLSVSWGGGSGGNALQPYSADVATLSAYKLPGV